MPRVSARGSPEPLCGDFRSAYGLWRGSPMNWKRSVNGRLGGVAEVPSPKHHVSLPRQMYVVERFGGWFVRVPEVVELMRVSTVIRPLPPVPPGRLAAGIVMTQRAVFLVQS